jgi:hypothetical protein
MSIKPATSLFISASSQCTYTNYPEKYHKLIAVVPLKNTSFRTRSQTYTIGSLEKMRKERNTEQSLTVNATEVSDRGTFYLFHLFPRPGEGENIAFS